MRIETRKIYVSGTNSYILTLPKEWVEGLGLKKGDLVFLEVRDKSLCIHPQKREKEFYGFIDDPEVTFGDLLRLLVAHYIAGFSAIKVKIYKEEQREAIVSATDLLIGTEILEDLGDEMHIEIFLNLERFKVDSVLEKMSGIILSLLRDLREVILVGLVSRELLNSVSAREREVDRLYFLLLRLLTLAGREGSMTFYDVMNYRSAVKALERISDHLKRIFENFFNLPIELSEVVDKLIENSRKTVVSFFKADRKIAEEVFKELETLKIRIGKIKEETEKKIENNKNLHTFFESLERVVGYLSDIAEISVDRSVLINTN